VFHLGFWLELRRWRVAGHRVRFWWRDDDAAGEDPNLERLLRIAVARAVPLTLAVVPSGDIAALAAILQTATGVTVIQHGVSHTNRRTGPVAGEFPPEWPEAKVRADVLEGWRATALLPGALKVFCPPWNDVPHQLPMALERAGYVALSANGELCDATTGGLPRLDVHVDLLRWRGGPRFRGAHRVLKGIAAEMRRRRTAGRWEAPIGILSHHLAHDEPTWAFLCRFLDWTARAPEVAWVSLADLTQGLERPTTT
jgi:hypothetical protein